MLAQEINLRHKLISVRVSGQKNEQKKCAANYPEEVERMVLMGMPYKTVNRKVKKGCR